MNSNAFFNRIEILLYSSLISAMTGINRARARLQHLSALPFPLTPEAGTDTNELHSDPKTSALSMGWNSIKAALLPLLLWIVLGFAAGFLIGMLNPR
jgi:hypothetical protein